MEETTLPPALPESSVLENIVFWLSSFPLANTALGVVLLATGVLIVHMITRRILLYWIVKLAKLSTITWDDVLIENKVFHRLMPIVPALLIHWGVVFVPGLSEPVITLVQRLALCTIVILSARSLSALIGSINDIYMRYPISRGRPLKGYFQVVQILIYIVAGIIVISSLMNQSPLYLLSGLGAMTAVLLLIFRDTLLSLVAGIQLTSNDLIRVGDWIEMPGFGADGDVVDIALNVVTVQNWDRTISVVPTHKFLDHSFKNWRSMFDAGGRRIKRSIHLDMSTIRFLTPDEIARFRRYVMLEEYIDQKTREIEAYNAEHCPSDGADIMANSRHLTNIGTFRAYVTQYLRNHPQIHQEMTFLIRQLQPTPQGLPLEIYVFTNDTRWAFYEGIQADVFDHILAIVPDFGLRVFQEPSGSDIARLAGRSKPSAPLAATDVPPVSEAPKVASAPVTAEV